MKNLLIALVFIPLLLLSSSCSENKHKKAIDAMNANLPLELGDKRLDKVDLDGETIEFYYTLLTDIEKPTPEAIAQEKEEQLRGADKNPLIKLLRKDNLSFSYIYSKQDGSRLYEIQITPEDYK